MKKRIVCILLASIVLITCSATIVLAINQETADQWKNAYQTLLQDTSLVDDYLDLSYVKYYFQGEGFEFVKYNLYDVDSDGIPELFLHSSTGIIAVFTYDDSLKGLGYNTFDGINKDTGEIIVHGHWHGAGGSGEYEWQIYRIQHSPTEFKEGYIDKMGERYSVYNEQTKKYEDDEERYYEIYNQSVSKAVPISSFPMYDFSDLSGFEEWNTPQFPFSEYIYDANDPGADLVLNTPLLNTVTDTDSAVIAVKNQTRTMSTAQKESPTGADLATLYAETAVAKAASKPAMGKEILINKAAVTELAEVAKQTTAAVESALVEGGVSTARYLTKTITLSTEETGEINIHIDPDILTADIDKIVVESPTYALTFKMEDLREDLTEILTFTAQDIGSGFAPGEGINKTTVKVNLPKGKTTNPVTVSLPSGKGDTTYQAVVNTNGEATSSKYNPARTTMDGKISTSGNYTVQVNEKDFSDIANKSAEMQNAIRYLASKGIIGGTGNGKFAPDGSITRAEIAALMVRALGKLDNSAKPTFTDVTTANWYYATAASSQKAKLINGYEDNTFRGGNQINKEQIVAVSARVLTNEMGYKTPANPTSYLGKYSDSVVEWARPEVALATKENLVVYRTDATFSGGKGMTRGDAAIIIYRLFQKLW